MTELNIKTIRQLYDQMMNNLKNYEYSQMPEFEEDIIQCHELAAKLMTVIHEYKQKFDD
jgi:hypothetical protein